MDMSQCAIPTPVVEIMQHVVNAESAFNPFAIGVVGGRLARQPANLEEAKATVHSLEHSNRNYSVGLAQLNRSNFKAYGITNLDQAFDICTNLKAGSDILLKCHARSNDSWARALSCYYSGDFQTGFRHGYVKRVIASMSETTQQRLLGSSGRHKAARSEASGLRRKLGIAEESAAQQAPTETREERENSNASHQSRAASQAIGFTATGSPAHSRKANPSSSRNLVSISDPPSSTELSLREAPLDPQAGPLRSPDENQPTTKPDTAFVF